MAGAFCETLFFAGFWAKTVIEKIIKMQRDTNMMAFLIIFGFPGIFFPPPSQQPYDYSHPKGEVIINSNTYSHNT
jgi:hypothetical protein